MWLWWQLVSKNADPIHGQLAPVQRQGRLELRTLTNATDTISEWSDKVYLQNATGAEDTTQVLHQGRIPNLTRPATGDQGRFVNRSPVRMDVPVMLESSFAVGCAGNL